MKDLSISKRILFALVFAAALAASVFCVLASVGEVPTYTVTGYEASVIVSDEIGEYEGQKININTASKEQLFKIPGIGAETADRIIDYRETFGSFFDVGELREIEGIGVGRFQSMLPYICT